MRRSNLVIFFSICVVKCLAMSRSELEDFSNFLEMTSQLDLNIKSKGPDDEYDEEELVSDNAWEESGKFEGDLILNERQRRLLVADIAEGLSRNGLQDSTKRWPNNEVIYFIQREHFSSGQVQAIQDGIDDLAQASCVKFTPYKKGDRDAVVIQGSRRGCFSQVGYQGGYQVLNLSGRHPVGRGCFRHGTVVHELLHALGFYHMQSSPDRDDYIDVLWQNIVQPARHNFRKYNSFAVSDFGVGYDYESVLHYSRKAFSSNGQDTLVPKQRGAEIGQRVGLSQKDIQKLNRMYCDADSNDAISSDDDSTPNKPTVTKKKSKNKPFDGHGIGYHQGKTVVIKIKPTVELYGLPTLPKFHVFDYFSKAPQAMSPSLSDGSRSGGKIIYTDNENIPFTSPMQGKIAGNDGYINELSGGGKVAFVKSNAGIEVVNEEVTRNNPLNADHINTNEFSKEQNEAIDQAFKKITKVIPQSYPAYADFDRDYSKYYNLKREYEKEPEIVKVDKLFGSSQLRIEDPAHYSGARAVTPIPLEFESYSKNEDKNTENIAPFAPHWTPTIMTDNTEEMYPLRKYYYNPEEKTIDEFQSPLRKAQAKNNSNAEEYVSLKNEFPLNDNWYTDDQYKRNPSENYDKKSYKYDPERRKENLNVETLPITRHYVVPENVHNSEMSNRKPYLLFDAPVPLTQKWYERDDHSY